MKFAKGGLINIKTEVSSSQLTVRIKDNGIGIEEDQICKLFKLFGKLDDHRNLNTNGIGLGLSICDTLIKSVDGKIGVNSIFGQGAEFYFRLPLSDRKAITDLDEGFSVDVSG